MTELKPKSVTEDNTVDSSMAYDQKIMAVLNLQNLGKTGHHPLREFGNGLSTPGGPKVDRVGHATLDLFRESLSHVLEAEPFPVAEMDFLELRANMVGHIMISADDARSLNASFEITGIDGLYPGEMQAFSKVFELQQACLGEPHIGVSINGESPVTLNLPVSDQIESAAFFHGEA